MTHRSYKDLKVWQKADALFYETSQEVTRWPKNPVTYTIIGQVVRSAGSISANMAEGYGRGTKKEFQRYLRIARGSAVETDNWLYKAKNLKYLPAERYNYYEEKITEITKMTNSFMRTLNT